MTRRPPPPPPPPLPPAPDLTGYRPYDDRRAGAPPPIEHRFGPPANLPPPVRRPPPPPRRKRRWLRAVGWTLGTLTVLASGAVAALVVFAPVGILRDQLIREVEVRTGRNLVITGPTSLSVWPALAVSMGDVKLSTPPGMGGAPFVTMRRLDASVRLTPLFNRRLEIKQIVLTEPVFDLRVDAKGRRSWDFAAFGFAPTIQYAQATRDKGGAQQGLPPELEEFVRNSSQGSGTAPASTGQRAPHRSSPAQDIAIGDVRVMDGKVRYRDERAGIVEEVSAINLRLTGKSLASPIEAKGDVALRGDKLAIDARLGSPKALLEERPSRFSLALASQRVGGRFDGSLSLSKGPQLDGNLKLDSRSLRALAQWLGVAVGPGERLAGFTMEAELKTGPTWLALNNAKARLDDVNVSGSANLDLVAGRPSLKANLRFGAVDLNAYLPRDDAAAAAPQPAATRTGPQVRGFTRRSGWSENPIDLAALGLLDVEARIALASLVYGDVKLGATQLGLALRNRAMRATFDDIRLYEGQGRGVITLDGNARVPALAVNLTVDGVAGLPLLKDAAGFDWIDGKAKLQLALGGQGATEKALVESLNGKAEISFADGAIVGYNIPQMIRGVSQGRFSGFNRVPTERTDFTEAAASFQIRNGVAETKDLRAQSPAIRLTGAGNVNLAQRQVDMTLRPRVVGSMAGQGGGGDLSGLDLPVRIRGPWERPQVGADLDSVLKNPGQAMDTLRQLGKQIQQGKGGEQINRFLDQLNRR
jgi:AsmA protein